jgi:pimeloyl-ACP methyl ester carboxylesterase
MEPDVRYCTTADGVRIAYTVTGEGPVNVSIIDPIVSHVALEWSHPVSKRILEETARYFTLVRFDSRGTGLSERVLPTSLDDTLLDIEAVVERLRLDQFTLQANTTSTPTAIAFATRHPDRVSRMVIIDGYARSRDLYAEPAVAAIMAAASSDWETATEAIGAMVFGPGRKESRMHGEYIRACIGPEYLTSAGSFASVDVSAMTSMLLMPVLVVRHAGVRWITDQMTQDLVAGIPDARLVIVNGTWPDDPEGLARRIAAFVYESTDPPAARGKHTPSGVRTVLFTDIVGHTEMMQRLGDAKGRDVLREHERITRETLKHHGGTELKTNGRRVHGVVRQCDLGDGMRNRPATGVRRSRRTQRT